MKNHRTKFHSVVLLIFFLLVSSGLSFAGNKKVRMILSVKKADYSTVEQMVKKLGGEVHVRFKMCEGLAVSLPLDEVSQVISRPEVIRSFKDIYIKKPEPPKLKKAGYENIPVTGEMVADYSKTLKTSELKSILGETKGYYPFTNELTGTNEFYNETGHFGENIVVGIIDDGVSSAASAVASRIIGAENFTGDGLPGDSPSNGSHGTWVACCVGANTIFGFGNPAVQNAIKLYSPESVIPDYFATGVDGIPMVGQAPDALFYALKVFAAGSNSAPSSVIAAGLERAVELKEMYNAGDPDGVNIRVANMSLGGGTLFAGEDEFYTPLIKRAHKAGMVIVISAGNEGPAGMTIGSPGDTKNVITVGATSDATHERIVADLFYVGPGGGYDWRPVDNNFTAYFSSRGPLADGRSDPDIVAPGTWRFAQNVNGSTINWVSGTSFSAPTVTGAVALLLSAKSDATPDQIRGALLLGADKKVLTETPGFQDQGFGFLDVAGAYHKLTRWSFNPPDWSLSLPWVEANIRFGAGIRVVDRRNYTTGTGKLLPGERKEIFYEVPANASTITVTVSSVTPALPEEEQNLLFGDDLIVAIHSAKTSAVNDYRAFSYVGTAGATFTLQGSDLDEGIARIVVMGDETNAGKISAQVNIQTDYERNCKPGKNGKVAEGESKVYSFNVPANSSDFNLKLSWKDNWGRFPTDDLDMTVFDPDGNVVLLDNDGDGDIDGLSLDSPERLNISNPAAGNWLVSVDGYTIWKGKEHFSLSTEIVENASLAKNSQSEKWAQAEATQIPDEFRLAQNYPNPFNPTTNINFDLPKDSPVKLKVYNAIGQEVATIVDEFQNAGYHSVVWNGRNEANVQLPSGFYIYRIEAGDFVQSRKMILLK